MDIEDIIYDLKDWWEDTLFDIKAFFNRAKDKISKPSVDIDAKTPEECYDIWLWRKKNNDVGDKTSELLLQKAADAGIPGALNDMAYQLHNPSSKKDLARAHDYAKQGAMQGHIGCQLELGRILKDQGEGQEAVRWLKKVVEQDPDQGYAMFILGEMYEKGAPGVEKDRAEAIMWYKKASKTTNYYAKEAVQILKRMNAPAFEEGEYMQLVLNAEVDGRKSIEDLYRWGKFWTMTPEPKHLAELLFAAQGGHAEAMVELSQIFVSDQAKLYGIYNEKMAQEYKEKAIEQYKTLASSGETYAINQLYKLLKDTDPDQAEQYMIQGANAGIPDCQFGLGEIYWKQGKFFDALKLFESAGEAGHRGAANRAREIYFNGAGPIQKNMDKANYWIKKVADISFGTMQKNQHL